MIRIIKSSTNIERDEVTININIDVFHYYVITSAIHMVYEQPGRLDSNSQREYDSFIKDIDKYMKSCNFKLEDKWEDSDRDDSISKYSVWTKDSLLMNPGKTYIVRIRISDHHLSEGGYDRENNYNVRKDNELREEADKLRRQGKAAKDYLKSYMFEIFINEQRYYSYKDALKEFKKELGNKMLM